VSDDCSTDGTWAYLEAWASEAPVRVTLIRNDPPLGVSANFEQAMRLVDADIVFPADQDDVWMPNKVALLAGVFEADDSVQLAHTDAILVDANGHELGSTLFGELEISRMERRDIRSGNAFRVYCRRNVVTGAAAAFRRRLIGLVQPLPPQNDVLPRRLAGADGGRLEPCRHARHAVHPVPPAWRQPGGCQAAGAAHQAAPPVVGHSFAHEPWFDALRDSLNR
jgi:glycosyltransferase involved in cell wall biosynthesis